MMNKLIKLIYPKVCLNCKEIISCNEDLCSYCTKKIIFLNKNYCLSCGCNLPSELKICGSCIIDPPSYTILEAIFAYNESSKNIVLGLKFFDNTEHISVLAKWMHTKCKTFLGIDTIIPVPLHRFRLFFRKYNQSAILARALAKHVQLPVELFALKRKRNTLPQAELPLRDRKKNIKNAFFVLDANFIKNKTILLIDDVVTTGWTIRECSKTLINSGAQEVRVMALGRVIR